MGLTLGFVPTFSTDVNELGEEFAHFDHTPLKNVSQVKWDDRIVPTKWKVRFMFQTTNQIGSFIGLTLDLPSGKRLHNYGKSPCYYWENSLCLWPCSIAMSKITRG